MSTQHFSPPPPLLQDISILKQLLYLCGFHPRRDEWRSRLQLQHLLTASLTFSGSDPPEVASDKSRNFLGNEMFTSRVALTHTTMARGNTRVNKVTPQCLYRVVTINARFFALTWSHFQNSATPWRTRNKNQSQFWPDTEIEVDDRLRRTRWR